jgi:hypothetical protein
MKRMILLFFLFVYSTVFGQVSAITVGTFKDTYIIWSETNILNAQRLTEGFKGDSCIIIGSLKSTSDLLWLKVVTPDTIGYVIAEFVSYDPLKVKPLKNNDAIVSTADFLKENKADWLIDREKKRQERIAKNERNKEELKKYISKNDLFIISHSFPETEYLKYPGFKVSIFNCKNSKTIKYTWFTLTAYNPVDDIVGTKTLQAIGPVYPLKIAEYAFESVFLSKIVDYIKISGIKIQYMDGSVLVFNKSQIESIFVKSSVFLNYLENTK